MGRECGGSAGRQPGKLLPSGKTLYSVFNIAVPWVIHIRTINISPQLLYARIRPRLFVMKFILKKGREQRGYSEYGCLNYPCLVSLAGDLDVANPFGDFGLFDRGWKWFYPQSCDGGE